MYIHFITRREKKIPPPTPKGLIISSSLVIYGLLPRETAKEGKGGGEVFILGIRGEGHRRV